MEGGYDKDFVQNTAVRRRATEAARHGFNGAMVELRAGKPVFVGPVRSNPAKVIKRYHH